MELLQNKIAAVTKDLREAVDLSIELRSQSPQVKTEVVKLWEEFLGNFFGYIKQRSRESKDNLLAGIAWTRLKLF
ncbi:MAG: hypothetical protein P4N59_30000 [Negativicutes bacterium]|nr:hypothetical protein [Negativicutes bacterium]